MGFLYCWREIRNVLEYSPYTPTDIVTVCSESISDAQEILTVCKQHLKGRGILIEDLLNSFPSSIIKTEVDFEELRRYAKQVFEEEYGMNSVVKVEAAQYNPYTIDITVYVREEKADMWDFCVKIAHTLRNQGLRAGIRTELIQ